MQKPSRQTKKRSPHRKPKQMGPALTVEKQHGVQRDKLATCPLPFITVPLPLVLLFHREAAQEAPVHGIVYLRRKRSAIYGCRCTQWDSYVDSQLLINFHQLACHEQLAEHLRVSSHIGNEIALEGNLVRYSVVWNNYACILLHFKKETIFLACLVSLSTKVNQYSGEAMQDDRFQ